MKNNFVLLIFFFTCANLILGQWIQTAGPSGGSINTLLAVDSNIFARTNGIGVWQRPLSEITSVGYTSTDLPNRFILQQNYPNPFNPTTSFEFNLAISGFVSIKVYNILGREVSTLLNEMKHTGTYQVNWNASALTSGVYFYKVQASNYSSVKKMSLIK